MTSSVAGRKTDTAKLLRFGKGAIGEVGILRRSWFRCPVKARARKGESRVAVWQSDNPAEFGFRGEAGFVVRSKRGQEKVRPRCGLAKHREGGVWISGVKLISRQEPRCSLAKRQSGGVWILCRSRFRCPVKARARKGESGVAVWRSGNPAEFEFRRRSWFCCPVKARARAALQFSKAVIRQSLDFGGEASFVV